VGLRLLSARLKIKATAENAESAEGKRAIKTAEDAGDAEGNDF
jgi:hypothetical protein